MPLPTPIFNIFDEFEALNTPNPLDTGGEWKLISAPTDPVDICVKDTVWETKNLNAGDIIYPGVHSVLIDFTGGSCAGSPVPDGTYVFEYGIATGDCPSYSEFTILVQDGNVTVNIERTTDACYYEIYTENPDTSGSKRIKAVLQDPNVLCAEVSFRTLVKRKNLDNCSLSSTTLYNNLNSYNDYVINSTNLPNPLGSLSPFYSAFYGGDLPGLFYMHSFQIYVTGWVEDDYIASIKLGTSGSPLVLDLSAVAAVGDLNINTNLVIFETELRTEIAAKLTAAGISNTECLFTVAAGIDPIGDALLVISFLCTHLPSGEWVGIDKDDWEFVYAIGGGNMEFVETNFDNDFVSMVPYVYDSIFKPYEKTYTIEDCAFYQHISDCQVYLQSSLCGSLDLYNVGTSNYNLLVLGPVGDRPNIIDYDLFLCGA